jgi:excisionase family DNA binding protein
VDLPSENLLTIKEAAEYLRVSESWLYRQAAGRSVPHYRLGRSVRFSRQELDAWLRRSQTQGIRAP